MSRLSGHLSTLVGLAAVALAVWYVRRPDPPAEAERGRPPFVLPVTLAVVEGGTLAPSVQLTGTVRSPARAQLSFEVAGELAELLAREVDRFEEGDVLARLDDRDEVLAVAEATAALVLARKELAKLEAGTRAEELQRLEAEHDELVALAVLAQNDVRRFEPLVTVDKIKSKAELERLTAVRDAADAKAAAKAAQVAEARAGTRAEDLSIAQARVDQAQARLDVANGTKAKTELVARRGGLVLARRATVGDHLSIGAPVLEVVDPTELEIAVEVPGRFVSRLEAAPPARLRADDLPGWSMSARLDVTIPVADEHSRNFTGLIRLDGASDAPESLQPGMFVRVDLDLRPVPDATIVPADCIRQTPDGPEIVRAVFGDPGPRGHPTVTAQVLRVEVLGATPGRAAVGAPNAEPPLAVGDRVVLTGVDSAFPGAALLPATREPREQGPPR